MNHKKPNDLAMDQAEILASALPFMQLYDGRCVVIKQGGSSMEASNAKSFAQDVVLLQQSGVKPVIVHGGGKQIDSMLERLNIKSEFKNGLRITNKETVEIVEMVLAGHINKKITDDIAASGGCAVGLSGRDGKLISAKKHQEEGLGFVGMVDKVDINIITTMLDAGIIPVIAPTASDEEGQVYNINADSVAGAIATHLGALRLIMMSDVIGLMESDGELIPSLSSEDANSILASGDVKDGMRPKIETCIAAVRGGVDAAVVLDGRKPHALLLELFTPHGVGTMIKR